MEQTTPNFFFFSKKDLNDFHYETHKFDGLRFFLELAIFLAVKLGANNIKLISIFKKTLSQKYQNLGIGDIKNVIYLQGS
jgi:hypothetical protein